MHRCHEYARDVVEGRTVAGRLVVQACERHLEDLESGELRGIYFADDIAERAVSFFPRFLRHSKGKFAGQPFALEPWQQFIVGNIYGWIREDGTRRFRSGYIEVGRKNGKSTTFGGLGLFGLIGDREPGAEVYTCATKMDQAKLIHSEAIRMVKQSRPLRKRLTVLRENVSDLATFSKYEPLGSDAKTLDGLNPSLILADELHAWKGRLLWEVLETALGARAQPLMLAITTAGYDRFSICWEQRADALQVLNTSASDDSVFAYIATTDEGDAWDDPANWIKANPNLGVSISIEYLEEQAEKAKRTPAKQNAFRRLHLNEWTQQETRFLNLSDWDACTGDRMPLEIEQQTEGAIAFGGLDLSSTQDITAFVLAIPNGEDFEIVPRFWIPGHDIEERVRTTRIPYDEWAREGWIKLTPGNVVDYNAVFAEIEALGARYLIRDIAFDRWGAQKIVNDLADMGFELSMFGQGYKDMNAPTKELERLVLSKRIRHGGHPVLRWMADNLETSTDPSGNIKPVKPDHKMSNRKIDGMVALIQALGAYQKHNDAGTIASVYEDRGAFLL